MQWNVRGNALDILGFTKDRGRIKAITSAYLAACLMNDFAKDPCRPNGGLPKNIRRFSLRGVQSRKFPH